MQYTEIQPAGPHPRDPVAEGQVGTAWQRRFVRELPAGHDGPLAFVEVTFALVETGPEHNRSLALEQHRRHLLADLGPAYYDQTLVNVVDTADGRHALTDQDAADACAAFDPTTLDWDGFPGSERPCEQVIVPAHGGACWVAQCHTHGGSPHAPVATDQAGAGRWWACDKGRGRVFLLDHTDPDTPPVLADLTGLNRAVVSAVETDYYGIDQGMPVAYLYRRPGGLVPLTMRHATDAEPTRRPVDDDDRAPLMISREWEVADPDGTVYTRITVTLNGDA